MSNLSFIGLGVMGFPMAGHLAEAGHKVTVYNRSTDKTKNWSSIYGGNIAKTAKFVGMERSALHRKLKGLGVKDLN